MTASAVLPALHPLLERQLRKLGLKPGQAADAKTLDARLARVLQVYADVDQERDLLHRSQELASGAMATLNEALHASRALLASLLSLSSDWVWEQDEDGRFVTVSDDLLLRTGIDAGAVIGQTCSIEGPLRATPEDLAQPELLQAARQVFRDITFELDAGPGAPGALAQPGTTRHLRISGEPVFDGPRRLGWRGVGSDATATVQADRKIQELARYDSLTGLPNRHLVMEQLGRALARSARHDSAFALLFIDLDRFKYVNDNLGHAAGDELLRTVGQRLRQMLREVDMHRRLGGDEFVVLTEGRCEPGTLTRLAGRILAAVAEPLVLEGRSVRISTSVGISIFPGDGSEAETLMRHADVARYQAKLGGKNAFGFFTPELARRAARGARRAALHFSLESDLRGAIDRHEPVLHYQPQVAAQGGALLGLQALVRWQHPQRGLPMPGDLIELAEDSGLIVPLGRWVLRESCRQMAAWRAEGLAPPPVAVNVSAR